MAATHGRARTIVTKRPRPSAAESDRPSFLDRALAIMCKGAPGNQANRKFIAIPHEIWATFVLEMA